MIFYSKSVSPHRAVLVLGILSLRSSYALSVEAQAKEVSDTIQWWFLATNTWRLRTYAIDRDVHSHCVTGVDREFAKANTRKFFGDVLRRLSVVEFEDLSDAAAVAGSLHAAGLRDAVEFSADGIPLWLPEDADYQARSVPG